MILLKIKALPRAWQNLRIFWNLTQKNIANRKPNAHFKQLRKMKITPPYWACAATTPDGWCSTCPPPQTSESSTFLSSSIGSEKSGLHLEFEQSWVFPIDKLYPDQQC